MSKYRDAKRYHAEYDDGSMYENVTGDWVRYSDYAALLDDYERLLEALREAMRCEACDGSGVLTYPPGCNCYGDPVCTHKETEGECEGCDGTTLRDIPAGRSALALCEEVEPMKPSDPQASSEAEVRTLKATAANWEKDAKDKDRLIATLESEVARLQKERDQAEAKGRQAALNNAAEIDIGKPIGAVSPVYEDGYAAGWKNAIHWWREKIRALQTPAPAQPEGEKP